jgi:hypothetical protein
MLPPRNKSSFFAYNEVRHPSSFTKEDLMFQQTFNQMLTGSQAVLTRPAVATFEEYERNDLQGATTYVAIAAIIAGIFGAIGAAIRGAPGGLIGTLIGTLFAVLLGFFIWLGLVYLLGRAFGGTGNFGELAFDVSLFYAPLLVLSSLLGIIPILGALVSLVVFIYQLYLTYLGIQSGMNLPKDKALYVILILFAIGLVIVACIALVFGAVLAAMMGASQQ